MFGISQHNVLPLLDSFLPEFEQFSFQYEISGSHSSEDVDVGLPGYSSVWTCFREILCLHLQGVTTQKMNIDSFVRF
jgi:hypothetical protein